jgi:hypothetical protein
MFSALFTLFDHMVIKSFRVERKKNKMENINQQIADLDRQERELEMELEDVLTDVSSPDNSDNEEVQLREEENEIARLFKNCILNAVGQPTEVCNFLMRFQDPLYRDRVRRKMKKIKKQVKTADIERVLANPQYMTELERIRRTYPNHGGREFLNELVAVYCVLN